MKHLALVFHAPLQSWGGDNGVRANKDTPKTTRATPTKAGVIGLLKSALGVSRGDSDTLNLDAITLAARTDGRGRMVVDYQVAQRKHHGFNAGQNVETPKTNLEDATFVVLVGHPDEHVIDELSAALDQPHFAPFFGRRAHVPAIPILLGATDTTDPVATLSQLPVLAVGYRKPKSVTIHSDTYPGRDKAGEVSDVMDGLDVAQRRYTSREYSVTAVSEPVFAEGGTIYEQVRFLKEHL